MFNTVDNKQYQKGIDRTDLSSWSQFINSLFFPFFYEHFKCITRIGSLVFVLTLNSHYRPLMNSNNFSILFDNPRLYLNQRLKVNERLTVSDIDTLINLLIYRRLFLGYLVILLSQYIFAFLCIPLDTIDNRPAIASLSPILLMLAFGFHSMTLPQCTVLIPNKDTLAMLIGACVSQTLGLVHTVLATVAVFRTTTPMLLHDILGQRDTTVYLLGVWILDTVLGVGGVVVIITITIMASRGIQRVTLLWNRLQEHSNLTVQSSLLSHELANQSRFFMP